MGFLIGLLTFVMVVDCLILIFLVLIQLPKKEAGAGLAFGAGATDALFGAGSGTVLTRVTKYAAIAFFVLAVIVGIMQSRFHRSSTSEFQRKLAETPAASTTTSTQSTPPSTAPAVVPASTNVLLSQPTGTTTPVPPPTNAPGTAAPQN
jgi:preprotein translocase subunit SecG